MEKTSYYLSIDIGASSGRHILSHMENGRIVCEEIYRFGNWNSLLLSDGSISGDADRVKAPEGSHRVWDTKRLFDEILRGMKKCGELGKIPVSAGVTTWGVDYVLLDENGSLCAPCYAYRDSRTTGMDSEVYKTISEEKLYSRTGIQKAIYNTIYALMASKLFESESLKRARSLLFMPDYFHFLLSGAKCQEYTIASTSGLLNPHSKAWDLDLIKMLGFPTELFGELSMPGTFIGELCDEVRQKVGFNCRIVLPPSHDTASAILSVPSESENTLYISSGTWSMIGCERMHPDCSERARKANFTNEGGYGGRFRFLKNIMGLWLIQSVKKEFEDGKSHVYSSSVEANPDSKEVSPALCGIKSGNTKDAKKYSFENLCLMASKESINSLVDALDDRFLAPESMCEEIKRACLESRQQVPQTPWEISRVIYRSLADCYRRVVEELEDITGVRYDTINIVGGGSNASWLNELTANFTGRRVLAGPAEGTAIGSVGAQMIADGVFKDIKEFRHCVRESFDVSEYLPD